MLISSLPEPIRKLAEQRYIEYASEYKHYVIDVSSAHIESFSWSRTEKYGEGPYFWDSIKKGYFTPYYAMYGLPEKWCIKCLPDWVDKNESKIMNKDWRRLIYSLPRKRYGNTNDEYYHKGGYVSSFIKEGYTEITLSDWIAANPEKKEETEELINGNNIPIQEEDTPKQEPSKKPELIESFNSTNNRLKRIEENLPILNLRTLENEISLESISKKLDSLINKLSNEDVVETKTTCVKDGPLIKVLYCDNISKNMVAQTDRAGFEQLSMGQVKNVIHPGRTVHLCDKIIIHETEDNGEKTGSVITVFVERINTTTRFVSSPFVKYTFK